ncbi:hypothetical protein EIN_183890 [Entamoeba invadens IP1]|uniref:hypothetical protein n=1 Tax=Entamoeba invadens IP1 TaxID=370355 RepID=UPI0002C3CE5A|nr:hypothetical protein EIN_183890 [Entamoeba invadens IP1]ELP94072.1 hypothetical protein EIN_183890 [Entamoeba invadens IP1]|eukprot:XP_004260843.1 hypothetical protein EIN_183890 [Entamoeba invadens IP1]
MSVQDETQYEVRVQLKQLTAEYTTSQFDFSTPVFVDTPKLQEWYQMTIQGQTLQFVDCPKKKQKQFPQYLKHDTITVQQNFVRMEDQKGTPEDPRLLIFSETRPMVRRTFEVVFNSKDVRNVVSERLAHDTAKASQRQIFGVSLLEYHKKSGLLFPSFLADATNYMKQTKNCFNLIVPTDLVITTCKSIENATPFQWSYSLAIEVLKYYFRSLPTPLIHPHTDYLRCFDQSGALIRTELMRLINSKCEEIYEVQSLLFTALSDLASERISKTPQNLASIFTPSLAWNQGGSMDKRMYALVEFLISNSKDIYLESSRLSFQ